MFQLLGYRQQCTGIFLFYLEEQLAPKSEEEAATEIGTGWTLLLALGKLEEREKSSLCGRGGVANRVWERALEELHSPEE